MSAESELEKMKAQFGEPAVGPDGKMSWNLGGALPPGVHMPASGPAPTPPVPGMSAGGTGVTTLPPVVVGEDSRQSPAVVPLLAGVLVVEVLRLLLDLIRLAAR